VSVARPDSFESDLAALLARDLRDPHRLLGAHAADGGVVVRAWRPDALHVTVHPEDGAAIELERVHDAGLFEGVVPGAELPLRYGLAVDYGEHGAFPVDDPYRHAPTIGELDEHLMGEGRHARLWERLGAHVRELDGVPGTSFAVWAPNARSISVVGDFNAWDGRLHPMRQLGSSGVWELFVPRVGSGDRYKFEVRTATGELVLHADPFAFAADVPPETNSIVHRSEHAWRDADWLARRAERDQLATPMSVYEVHLPSWRRRPEEPPTSRRRRATARPTTSAPSSTACTSTASACCSTGSRRTSRATCGRLRASTAPRSTSTPTRAAARTPTGAR